MPKVIQVKKALPEVAPRKRVAAYARVSMETDRLMHSLSAQVSYYSGLIQKNPEWDFAGVYSDEGITGTLVKKRDGFKRMVADCEAGKIDIILTKSIQRFARNTVDLLETVRHLKDIGVEVRFEKENISTMSGDGELMLTILASFAQEEVRSLSENVRWSRRKKIDAGESPVRFKVMGYGWEDSGLVIEPKEAETVRRIFKEFIGRKPIERICDDLNADGLTTKSGEQFNRHGVRYILTNPIYKGDLLLQKTFRKDPITKGQKKNEGEMPMVLVENDHEPIVDAETFEAAQKELQRRRDLYEDYIYDFNGMRMFTYKVKCKETGESFRHQVKHLSYGSDGAWTCFRFDCPLDCDHKTLPDLAIQQACRRAFKVKELDEQMVKDTVDAVIIPKDGQITLRLSDGREYNDFFRDFSEDIPAQGRNTNVFSRKLVCGCCGSFYKASPYKRKGIRRVIWGCRNCKGNSYIHENILRYRVAEAAGWDEFSFERFKDEVDRVDMDEPCHLTIRFKDGGTEEAEYISMDRRRTDAEEDYKDTRD